MEKRLAGAAVALVLAVSILVALAGCGAGAQQSEDLMTFADSKMMKNWKAVGAVKSSTDDLVSWLSGTLEAGGGIDEGGFDESVEELRGRIAGIQAGYDEAAADYREMVDITAPEGYAAYATLKLREIKTATALLNEIEGFLIRTSQRLLKTGLDSYWFAAEVTAFNNRFDELYEKAVRLGMRATTFRESDGFGLRGPLPASSPSNP